MIHQSSKFFAIYGRIDEIRQITDLEEGQKLLDEIGEELQRLAPQELESHQDIQDHYEYHTVCAKFFKTLLTGALAPESNTPQ